MKHSRRTRTVFAIALASMLAGCATWNEMDRSERGLAVGATGGALVGAAVGGPPGAVVGAAVGGYTGHHEGPRYASRSLASAPPDHSASAPGYNYPGRYSSDSYPNSYAVYSYPSYPRGSGSDTYGSIQPAYSNPTYTRERMPTDYYGYPITYAEVVRDAQLALRSRGYRPGVIDGRWGPNTEQAVREFQRTQRLAMTGTLDRPTLLALGVEP